MLSQAYSPLGFRIVDGVVGAGFPQKPSHSAVFAQIDPAGSRLSELARGANMSPQAMGGVVDELESLGYVIWQPDPRDRGAKLIVLGRKGKAGVEAGRSTIEDLEDEITQRLGHQGHHPLRRMLEKLLDAE
jgi:DNA-binding MarR family transcriptional regulator